MKRRQIPQLSAQPWFPRLLVRLLDEFLHWFVGRVGAARPFLPVLEEALARSNERRLIDLKTGPGSGAVVLRPYLDRDISVESQDLATCAGDEPGVYTVINGFHQLAVPEARDLLRSLAEKRRVILILEGNNDNWWQAVGMLVFAPLTALLTAPFVKPFRPSRLVFTYLLPILPFLIAVDGVAALFKLYAPQDLDELFSGLDAKEYEWTSGKRSNGRGGQIIYAIGYPRDARPEAREVA